MIFLWSLVWNYWCICSFIWWTLALIFARLFFSSSLHSCNRVLNHHQRLVSYLSLHLSLFLLDFKVNASNKRPVSSLSQVLRAKLHQGDCKGKTHCKPDNLLCRVCRGHNSHHYEKVRCVEYQWDHFKKSLSCLESFYLRSAQVRVFVQFLKRNLSPFL